MAIHNEYLVYKRNTQRLVYWIIRASNAIIRSSPKTGNDAPTKPNTTGQTTVSGLLTMSELIVKHITSVPSVIYRLFQSVIKARLTMSGIFQAIVAQNPDPEMERSNISHQFFTVTLTKAFETLGGKQWMSSQTTGNEGSEDMDGMEDVIFANKFSCLDINGSKEDGEKMGSTSDEGSDQDSQTGAPLKMQQQQQQKKSSGKGKKGKRGKKAKSKRQQAAPKEPVLEVPLESYRIIEDQDGLVTEYLMAVYALIKEWMQMRFYVQGLWREVAYDGLNSAIAGTLSNMAIAMIKESESAIFVDFPGHEFYETVMNTITRGNPEKAQGMFSVSLHRMRPDSDKIEQLQETHLDVKEHFLIHAYQDLVDFITDFQKTRSGKPTKRMLAEINEWDPDFDLQRASKEQRTKWRRAYTINWLYDLVNVFSSIVVQRNTMRGENHTYEKVDWSTSGPWNEHRRLFGLNEFAGTITSLAMQRPNTDVRQKICPHHVFQLQCIVDAFTASRDWSLNSLKGHVLESPARAFRPRRDVDLFLDRENERTGSGYLQAVDILKQLFEKDAVLHGDPNRHQVHYDVLKVIQVDFRDWLGESQYMYGLKTIPPSRFSNSNSNGLWEYSPFLCGVGLMESLELSYRVMMMIWDRIPEPILLVHLHNMLVQKGYITEPVGLYASLQDLFPTAFFAEGKIPTLEFGQALLAQISETGSRRAVFHRRAIRRTARSAVDIHEMLKLEGNRFFNIKSNLLLYREADWNPERIPETDMAPTSILGLTHLAQTNQVVDPQSGERRLEDTDLVNRARAQGMEERTLLGLSSVLSEINESHDEDVLSQSRLASLIPDGYRTASASELNRRATSSSKNSKHSGHRMSRRELLELSKWDMHGDICGSSPLSSLNYVWVTIRFMILFMQIEDDLKRVRNPLWVRSYEAGGRPSRDKRVGLTYSALHEQDDECLRTMAKAFQSPRAGFMNHIYWEDLDETAPTLEHEGDVPECVVM